MIAHERLARVCASAKQQDEFSSNFPLSRRDEKLPLGSSVLREYLHRLVLDPIGSFSFSPPTPIVSRSTQFWSNGDSDRLAATSRLLIALIKLWAFPWKQNFHIKRGKFARNIFFFLPKKISTRKQQVSWKIIYRRGKSWASVFVNSFHLLYAAPHRTVPPDENDFLAIFSITSARCVVTVA